ncbi:MAG: copper amine oxidase N-terminal domain-containing protein [Candidatus Eremiobacterota bacterium]
MTKYKIFLCIFSLYLLTTICLYGAEEKIKIVVAKTGKNFYSTGITDEKWNVCVPLRDIISAMGDVTIQWEPDEGVITAETDEHWCQIWIGKNKATVDGESVYLTTPPFKYKGRTFVPATFIGEALGKEIKWNYNNKTLTIK